LVWLACFSIIFLRFHSFFMFLTTCLVNICGFRIFLSFLCLMFVYYFFFFLANLSSFWIITLVPRILPVLRAAIKPTFCPGGASRRQVEG